MRRRGGGRGRPSMSKEKITTAFSCDSLASFGISFRSTVRHLEGREKMEVPGLELVPHCPLSWHCILLALNKNPAVWHSRGLFIFISSLLEQDTTQHLHEQYLCCSLTFSSPRIHQMGSPNMDENN